MSSLSFTRSLTRLSTLLAAVVCLTAVPLIGQQPTGEAWQIVTPFQATLVSASNGALIGEIGRELRTNVSIHTLPKYVGQAFVAVEDQRFYQHNGVDLIGIAGALKDNLLGGHRGASTITQQLVGNMHPDIIDRTDKSLDRKLREQSAAREMERHYTKEQILEAYLNQISFGHRYFGIESAAQHYFGKPASQLTLAEAATLAAMPKGPALYNPITHPDHARERRNLVLALMAQQGYITHAQATAAAATPIVTVEDEGMAAPAQYIVDVVRTQALRAGVPVDAGGYHITTSVDPLLQRAATEALQEEATAVEGQPNYPHPRFGTTTNDYLQGAVVVIDPTTGDVLALVGGRDYARSPFDRAVDGMRQPGSSFKPIVYATALTDSIASNTLMGDTAIAVPLPNGTYYRPEDDDHRYLGPITLREALAKSRNIVAVELWQRLGPDSVISTARRMGITSPIAPVPASAIGASAVQPLNLISAYTTFANLGTPVQPRFIYRIEDAAGKVVMAPPIRALPPALDPRTSFVMRDMMRDVVEHGTATAVRRYVSSQIPVAGKTGTTNDNTDVWFIGMTPDLVAGVWLGFDAPKPIMKGAFGGSLAAPVWGKIMEKYYAAHGMRHSDWTPPIGVISAELDRATGQLATATTPTDRRYTEYFVEGTEPTSLKLDPSTVFQRGALVF
ncbi:MAG TPA: PBP1A family penicillin-binding protein [Gemmatimonadaceae bacterium]|jgi:1A family penicillin-binding protein|nr:PBP1A family penicillin-binding protein [Gemmatimonadaceae bacterium]